MFLRLSPETLHESLIEHQVHALEWRGMICSKSAYKFYTLGERTDSGFAPLAAP